MKSDFQVQQINTMLKHLVLAYKHCNMYNTLKDMIYDPEREEVIVSYYVHMSEEQTTEIYNLRVNVACDSFAAMIHDVEQKLYKFFS